MMVDSECLHGCIGDVRLGASHGNSWDVLRNKEKNGATKRRENSS